jgi:hypothetical protein
MAFNRNSVAHVTALLVAMLAIVAIADQCFWQEFIRQWLAPATEAVAPVPVRWLGLFAVGMAVAAFAIARGWTIAVWLAVAGLFTMAWKLNNAGFGYPTGLLFYAGTLAAFVWLTPWLVRRANRKP